MTGTFGIGIYHGKNAINIGTLWRHAEAFGANFIFTVGKRYKKQSSDVWKSWKRLPLFHYQDFNDLRAHLPYAWPVIGVENGVGGSSLTTYNHFPQACYLLGAEDHGLPKEVLEKCHGLVEITEAQKCLNVAGAGTLLMWDRVRKLEGKG